MKVAPLTVFMADLIGSRRAADRSNLAKAVPSMLATINRLYKRELHAPLQLTKGIDEFSGLLCSPERSLDIGLAINDLMSPHLFRFTVATGSIDIDTHSGSSRVLDGEAFHTAADLMTNMQLGSYYSFRISDDALKNSTLSALADLVQIMYKNLTPRQRKIVQSYVTLGNQLKVAKKLGITQQAVSDAMVIADWRAIQNGQKVFDAIVSTLRK